MKIAHKQSLESMSLTTMLEKAVSLAYAAVESISREDHAGTRAFVDQLRFVRASATAVQPDPERDALAATNAGMSSMRCAMESIAIASEEIQHWMQRRIEAVAKGEVSDSLEIWQSVVDQIVPLVWDYDTDLLVIFGQSNLSLRSALEIRGQRRVLFVSETGEPKSSERPDYFFAENNDDQIVAMIENLRMPFPSRVAFMDLDGELGKDSQANVQKELVEKSLMKLWMEVNTTKLFGRIWVEQGVGNMPILAAYRNLSELDDLYQGLPALLIAPGPSLDGNIDHIREIKDKALLLAPLQSLRRLFLAGIQPDFAVVLDPADQTIEPLNFFKDVPDEFLPPLLAAANTHPNVLRKFRKIYIFASGGPMDHWMEKALDEPLKRLVAPSVALTGFLIANHWRCNPIILTGQDLALKDGQQYAIGGPQQPAGGRKLFTLPGFYGGSVQAPSDYFLFHHIFELLAYEIVKNNPETALFNCTEGGAFIGGFSHQSLTEVSQSKLTLPIAKQPNPSGHLQSTLSGGEVCVRLNKVRAYLEDCLAIISASIEQADRCRRTARTTKANEKSLSKLAGQEQRLRELIKKIAGFSVLYQDDIENALRKSSDALVLKENLAASVALYDIVTDGCNELRPIMQRALDLCETKINSCGSQDSDECEALTS